MKVKGTTQPFAEALAALRAADEVSLARLSEKVDSLGGPTMGESWLSQLERGLRRPTPQAMRYLARAFDRPDDYFVEYRLAQLAGLFDPEQQGLEQAVAEMRWYLEHRSGADRRRRAETAPRADVTGRRRRSALASRS